MDIPSPRQVWISPLILAMLAVEEIMTKCRDRVLFVDPKIHVIAIIQQTIPEG